MSFKDLFSDHAESYAANRPQYPKALFDYLIELSPNHQLAWDCATGNGQAAIHLAESFDKVIATDASQRQIDHALASDNVEYLVSPAEHTPLNDKQVSLISVAQAAHWFKLDEFYKVVKRVLQADGILAIFGYNRAVTGNNSIDEIYNEFCYDYLWNKECWEMEREIVNNGYAEIEFPFHELECPEFQIVMNWDREQYLQYLNTWSAVKKHIKLYDDNPVSTLIRPRLEQLWPVDFTIEVKFPIVSRIGRN